MHSFGSFPYRRLLVSALAMMLSPVAFADLAEVDIDKNIVYAQTALGSNIFGYFFSAGAWMQSMGDYDSGFLTYPGANSPVALSDNGSVLGFQSPWISENEFNTEYLQGAYTFEVTNQLSQQTSYASISYSVDAFTTDIPALTQESFSALQGVNSGASVAVQFNAFAPHPAADQAFTFFTIFDLSAYSVTYSAYFLDPSTTSVLIPSDTLIAGHQYRYELIFDSRVLGFDNGIATSQLFDVRTFGEFTTAVPEPDTYAMLLAGLGLLVPLTRYYKRS